MKQPPLFNKEVANRIIDYLHVHPLPRHGGAMAVMNAGDGEHAWLDWAQDGTVVTVPAYHRALLATQLAEAMRSYP